MPCPLATACQPVVVKTSSSAAELGAKNRWKAAAQSVGSFKITGNVTGELPAVTLKEALRGGPVVGAFFIWLTRVLDNAHWLAESARSPEVGLKVLEEELAPLEAEVRWRGAYLPHWRV